MTRRLTELHVAGNDRVEDFLFEELAHIARNELTKVRSIVVHRQQHALDLERRIQAAANTSHRADKIGKTFERKVLAVERNQHRVCGHQRVEREQSERWWAVDEDVVEARPERVEDPLQSSSRSGNETISISAPVRFRSAGSRNRFATRVDNRNDSGVSASQQGFVDGAGSARCAFDPSPLVRLPCGSTSTSRTFLPASARDVARLIAVVVLPTPPF